MAGAGALAAVGEVWRRPGGRTGLVLTLGLAGLALGAPLMAGYDPNAIDAVGRMAGPSAAHWLGTDHLGRDLLARGLFGGRVALAVALSVTAVALALGTLLGLAAAFGGPWAERVVLFLFDIVSSFPSLILALALVAVLGPGLLNVVILVTVVFLPQFGRVARAQALALRQRPFVEAERALGASGLRILVMHVLPNLLGPLAVLASMNIPVVITLEAGLSFLGVGIRPPLASWGSMLFDGYTYLDQSVWPMAVATALLSLASLGFTLLGESLRDAIDPTLRRAP